MAKTASTEQLEAAIHELDDIYNDLKTISRSTEHEPKPRKPELQTYSLRHEPRRPSAKFGTIANPTRHSVAQTDAKRYGNDVIDDVSYKYPSSKPLRQEIYQTPKPIVPSYDSYNRRKLEKAMSHPNEEPIHGSYPLHYNTVGRSYGLSAMNRSEQQRISSDLTYSPPPSYSHFAHATVTSHSDSDYDEVPDENLEEKPTFDVTNEIPDYDEIPEEPLAVDYVINDTLPYTKDKDVKIREHTSPMYTKVDRSSKIKVTNNEIILEMNRLDNSAMTESYNNTAYVGERSQAPPPFDGAVHGNNALNVTSQLETNSDNEWDDVSINRSMSSRKQTALYIPESTGPVIDATRSSKNKDKKQRCVQCERVMAMSIVLAFAMFLAIFICYIYIGKKNDDEIASRLAGSG